MAETPTNFDFVITGDGTFVLILADRLSKNPDLKVLLVLEAGKSYLGDPRVNMPAGWPALLETEVEWNLEIAPQISSKFKFDEGLNERVMSFSQGRVLGGSSAESSGNTGWNWNTLAPYFRKFHTLVEPSKVVSENLGLHKNHPGGKTSLETASGPIQVSFPKLEDNSFPKDWKSSFANSKYDTYGDFSQGTVFGPYSSPATVHATTGQRSYSSVAYYEPIIDRPNLIVLIEAFVIKIIMVGKSSPLTATGVSCVHGGFQKTFNASKKVILAAGALGSPKIFELSGIGSSKILELYGIDVRIPNVNVGENLQDHILSGISFEVADGIGTSDDLSPGHPEALVDDFQTEGQAELQQLLQTYPASLDDPPHHESIRSLVQNVEQGNGMIFMYNAQGNLGVNLPKELVKADLPDNFVTISADLPHPLSAGYVHISSANPTVGPDLDFKYFSNPLDLEVLSRHLRFINKLAATEPLASMLKPNGKRNKLYTAWEDLDDVKKYVQRTEMSNWHAVGTCAMLPEIAGGVVDTNLTIYGTSNLRILDASIMPSIARGNNQAVVYAVAERAADIIKNTI